MLAGELILTFYKPLGAGNLSPQPKNALRVSDPAAVLSEVFDVCLSEGTASFTSEALFNRLVIELWRRRELNCLRLNRDEFASRLQQRGWTYNAQTHLWSHNDQKTTNENELRLFA